MEVLEWDLATTWILERRWTVWGDRCCEENGDTEKRSQLKWKWLNRVWVWCLRFEMRPKSWIDEKAEEEGNASCCDCQETVRGERKRLVECTYNNWEPFLSDPRPFSFWDLKEWFFRWAYLPIIRLWIPVHHFFHQSSKLLERLCREVVELND